MTRSRTLSALVLSFPLATATTGCEFEDVLGEVGVQIPGTDYCLGVGVEAEDGEVEWADVAIYECVPDGHYSCDYSIWFDGAFGGETCMGAYALPDSYSLSFTTSDEVTLATIEWETDMMDAPQSMTIYPVHDGNGFLYTVHFLNPGYGSDGDKIDYSIRLYSGELELQDPVVSATLDGNDEDVRYDADDREYTSSW